MSHIPDIITQLANLEYYDPNDSEGHYFTFEWIQEYGIRPLTATIIHSCIEEIISTIRRKPKRTLKDLTLMTYLRQFECSQHFCNWRKNWDENIKSLKETLLYYPIPELETLRCALLLSDWIGRPESVSICNFNQPKCWVTEHFKIIDFCDFKIYRFNNMDSIDYDDIYRFDKSFIDLYRFLIDLKVTNQKAFVEACGFMPDDSMVRYLRPCEKFVIKHVNTRHLLKLSGDIEENPGPTEQELQELKEQNEALLAQLNKVIYVDNRKLNKEIHSLKHDKKKQKAFIQRQIELEKRARSKARKERCKYAQGATEIVKDAANKLKSDVTGACSNPTVLAETAKSISYAALNIAIPGAGTTAAAVVNGSKVTRAIDQLNPTIEMIQKVLGMVTDAMDSFKELFKLPKDIDLINVCLSLAAVLESIRNKSLFFLPIHAANLARLLGVTLTDLMSLVPNFSEADISFKSGSRTEHVAQSFVSDLMYQATQSTELLPFAGILSFCCGIFSLLCAGSIPSPGEMIKHFTNVGRAASGFKAMKDLFTWAMDYMSQIYYQTVYGLSLEEYEFMLQYPKLENLYAAVRLIEKLEKPLIDGSADIAGQILTVNHELNEYALQAAKAHSRPNSNVILTLQRRIAKQVDMAANCPARCISMRDVPVTVYLYGRPGVGKSVVTEMLKAKLYKDNFKGKVSYINSSFVRKSGNDHWEGYTGQPILILDDFGNLKDSLNKPVVEYAELEYMVNNQPYPLHMAALASKGVSYFNSEFIIASSNQERPEIVSLVDPGAVYRRFHIWADVTIDPKFGVPLGVNKDGSPYYQYDKFAAAKALGVPVEEVPALSVEHYRFNCYRVSYNLKESTAEISYIPGKQGINFDEFWNHFKEETKSRQKDSRALSNAIREMAGEPTNTETPEADAVMKEFAMIFDKASFLEALANDENYNVEEYTEAPTSSDSIFGSIDEMFHIRKRYETLLATYDSYTVEFSKMITDFWGRMTSLVDASKNKLLSFAEFILSALSALAGKAFSYLPSIPTSKVLTTICATAAALLGAWYSGLFRSNTSKPSSSWCEFNRSPSNSCSPCTTCVACNYIEYPPTGDMLLHYFEKTGQKSVRQALLSDKYTRDQLEDAREHARLLLKTRKRVPTEKCEILQYIDQNVPPQSYEEANEMLDFTCLAGCDVCSEITNSYGCSDAIMLDLLARLWPQHAQRVYDQQPRVVVPRNYAQKLYDQNPRSATRSSARAAQGRNVVRMKMDATIGAKKFAQNDLVQIQQTTRVILNNAVLLQVRDSHGKCSRSNGIFLVGRTLITTAHSVLFPPHEADIVSIIITNPHAHPSQDNMEIPITSCKITQLKQLDGAPLDLALISFPPIVPSRPKILSKFIDADMISLLSEGELVMSGMVIQKENLVLVEKHPQSFNVSTKRTQYYLHPGICPVNQGACECRIDIGNHIMSQVETQPGYCGSLISIKNKLIHTKLVGFHVAGGEGVPALGILTSRQLLERSLTEHVQHHNIPETYLIDGRLPYAQFAIDPNVRTNLVNHGDCLNVGTGTAPASPVVTQLRPSAIFDKVQQHTTKPAHLKPTLIGDTVVDPMMKGIKKVMGGQVFLDEDLLAAAVNDVFNGLEPPPGGRGTVHTYEEAIKGVEGDPYKRPINRTTSPGYPYNLNNTSKGKTAWLGEDEYILDNPELKQDVDKLIADAKKGVRGDAISLATLKDEKRPIHKVDEGKTRVFEACPQHLVIAIRQYFLDFAAHIMRNRIKNGIAVGINPYSLEWTQLAHHLLEMGDNMIAGDFANFDGSLLMQVLIAILEAINRWYGDSEEAQLIRAALFEHIVNADIIVKGQIIRKTHSQPSGNPLTVIINSLFNAIIMRYAYLLLKKKLGLPAVCDYRKYVKEAIYGDDDIKSVDASILSWFNQETLTEILKTIGLTYTDESKTGVIVRHKPLSQTAFLKRNFVIQNDGTYMAPMEITNILEITNWIKGKAVKQATVENCEMAIMELSLHPKETYDYWSNRIRQELWNQKITITVPTYFEQMETYRYERDGYTRVEYVPLW